MAHVTPKPDTRLFTCDLCGRPFTMQSGDNIHVIRVGRLYKDGCNDCVIKIATYIDKLIKKPL